MTGDTQVLASALVRADEAQCLAAPSSAAGVLRGKLRSSLATSVITIFARHQCHVTGDQVTNRDHAVTRVTCNTFTQETLTNSPR